MKWHGKSDEGLAWLLSQVIQNSAIPHFSLNQKWIAKYLCNVTLKFPTFVKILNFIIIKLKKYFIMFTDWLTSKFDVEDFLKVLNFKILILRIEMSIQEYSVIVIKFNNFNNNIEILLIIYIICFLRLNLHYQYNNIMCFKLIININILFQDNDWIYHLE